MEYLSCSDASKAMGFSVRRIQQMCKNGELPGAIKEGRKWLIPDETIHMNHFAKNKSLPIGVSDRIFHVVHSIECRGIRILRFNRPVHHVHVL